MYPGIAHAVSATHKSILATREYDGNIYALSRAAGPLLKQCMLESGKRVGRSFGL